MLNDIIKVEDIGDRYIAELEAVYRRIISNINKLIGRPDIILTAQDIQNVLVDSGYYQVGEGVLTIGQQEVMQRSVDYYEKQLKMKGITYGENAVNILESMRTVSADSYTLLGDTLAQKLTKEITNVSLGLASQDSISEAVQKALDLTYAQSKTWVHTAISEIHRTSTVLLGEQANIQYWEYWGPDDQLTRPFCQEHLGQIKTMEEWKAMDNGQTGSVATDGAGYNCRHRLVPAA